MNKEKLWEVFLRKNPKLSTDPNLTPESLRRLFDITWNTAYEVGCLDMAERDHEIADAQESAGQNQLLSALENVEQALSAMFGTPVKTKKFYATKKANTKKIDGGAE